MQLNKNLRKTTSLLIFVLPALILYFIFMLVPVGGAVWYSLTDWNGLNRTYKFIGLQNYIDIIKEDPYFVKSFMFTLKYTVFMVVLQNVIALVFAVLIETRKKTKALFRTLYFMPNMLSMVIGGFMWLFIFTRVLPYIAKHQGIKFLDKSWIGDPKYSFYAILIVALWGGVGYLMVIYIAAIQGVPQQLKEAATIDGATSFQTFKSVTFPMIFHSITIGIFISLSSSFKVFDAVYALTGGGPGRQTQVIALNIFEEAFARNNRYGYASAKAMLLFLTILVITIIQLYLMKRKEVEA